MALEPAADALRPFLHRPGGGISCCTPSPTSTGSGLTTDGLLGAAKSYKGRKELAAKTGIDEKRLLKWANSADRMRIKGVGDDYSELIRAAGVDTVRELKFRNAKRLTQAMGKATERRK